MYYEVLMENFALLTETLAQPTFFF